jgi:hypothetical protein
MKNPSTPPSEPRWITYNGSFEHLRLSVTNEDNMIKEGQDVGEAGEKKQGRKACLRSKTVSAHGRYLLTILVGLD